MTVTPIRPGVVPSIAYDPIHQPEPHAAAEGMRLVAAYVVNMDPAAVILLDGQTLTPTELAQAANIAEAGGIPNGLTVTVTSRYHRATLATMLRAPILEYVGGAVAGPGGLRVLIRAGEQA